MLSPFLANFIITQWIWSITGGFSYLAINFILLFLLLKLWAHLKIIKALALSLFLTIVPMLIFFALVGIPIIWGHVPYTVPASAYTESYNTLNTSLIMVGIYGLIQIPLVSLLRKYIVFYPWAVLLCLFCANCMSALLIYKITMTI